jgi:hypothetical protein
MCFLAGTTEIWAEIPVAMANRITWCVYEDDCLEGVFGQLRIQGCDADQIHPVLMRNVLPNEPVIGFPNGRGYPFNFQNVLHVQSCSCCG